MNVLAWRSEGGAALAAAPASAPAPHPNSGPSEAEGSGGPLVEKEVKEEEEETLGQLRDRQALASARASALGPRAVFVHIKVEDTDGEGAGGGDGEEATGGEGDGEREGEEEEEAEKEDQAEDEEDEEKEGQQREHHADAGADEVAPPQRARPPPGSYADTAVDYDEEEEEDDEDDEEEWGQDEVDDEEEEEWGEHEVVEGEAGEADPRDPRAQGSGAGMKGGSEEARPQKLPPGGRTEPRFPRARVRALGRLADNDGVQYDDAQKREEEEAGMVPEIAMRGGGDRAGSSQFVGVSWNTSRNKWRAQCKGRHLGFHTTEEAAAQAYIKYLEDGIVPAKRRESSTSQFKGVSWDKSMLKWRAECRGARLGCHATEEEAARALNKFIKDGIDPVDHREAHTSQFTGVSWNKSNKKWKAKCKGTRLGYHATEEAAARAYNKYLKDGIDPIKHRDATNTSQFMGVHRVKSTSKWRADCKGIYLGLHAAEKAAAQAYNVEAKRLGIALNVIPPTRAAGAGGNLVAGGGAGPGAVACGGGGPKRATPKTPASLAPRKKTTKRAAPTALEAPAPSKKMKLLVGHLSGRC
jgi:hypothetical protein